MIFGPIVEQSSSDRQWLNIGLVLTSATLGVAGLLFPKQSRTLFAASATFYGFQWIECLTSDTWGYICNVKN